MSPEAKTALPDLLAMMQKVREDRAKARAEGNCSDPDKDCPDLLSPCCKAAVSTVFGTLPLQIVCAACGGKHLLRDVVSALPKV